MADARRRDRAAARRGGASGNESLTVGWRRSATGDWIDGAAGAVILPYCIRVEIPLNGEALLLHSPPEASRLALRGSTRDPMGTRGRIHDHGILSGRENRPRVLPHDEDSARVLTDNRT